MKKLTKQIIIGIIAVPVLLVGTLIILNWLNPSSGFGACHGYQEVGEFNQKINSETDAKQIASDYFSSIGYEFNLEELPATKIKDGWSVKYNFSKVGPENLCVGSANPPECLGQELRLEERFFGKNKILMEYMIPC